MNHRPRLGRSRAAPPINVDMPGSGAEEIGWTLVGTTRRATDLVSVLKILVVRGEFCSRKLSDIFFYRPDIPRSTTIM
jgi:hypothetical protein